MGSNDEPAEPRSDAASPDAASSEEQHLIPVAVKGLILDPTSNDPIVILRDEEGARFLPIWIGVFEANAIALAIEGVESKRPLSHDLMVSLVAQLEAQVARVAVVNLEEGTFFAEILLTTEGGHAVAVDARPSDAIALALRMDAPLLVSAKVFDKAQQADHASRTADEEKLKKWLEEVDPDELGKYTM